MNVTEIQTTIKGVVYEQFGHSVAAVQMPLSTLQSFFKVDTEVQRELSPERRREIRDFIINSLEQSRPFYFSSFVFSSRGKLRVDGNKLYIEPGDYLYALDGFHRYSSMNSAIHYLETEAEIAEELKKHEEVKKVRNYIKTLQDYPISMLVFLDLTLKEEKQCFTDLNHERKEIQSGQLFQYDQRDEYSRLTVEVADRLKDVMEIEYLSTRLTDKATAATNLTIMKRCFIALFEGILTHKKGNPYYRNCNPKDVPKIAETFFNEINKMYPNKMKDRKNYVIGLSGIQLTLAYLVFYLVREQKITHLEAIQQLHVLKKQCTFKHDDPLFSFMYDANKNQLKNHSTTTAINKLMLAFLDILHKERKEV